MLKRVLAILLVALVLLVAWRAWNHSLQRVTLDVRNALLADVAAAIARQTGASVEAEGAVTNLVTMELRKVPMRDAIELAAQQADCRVEMVGEKFVLKPLFDWSKRLPHHLAGPPPGEDMFQHEIKPGSLPPPGAEPIRLPFPGGGDAPPEALRRPPPPPRELPPIADLMREGIRNSTPEQRAIRLRETRNVAIPQPPQ